MFLEFKEKFQTYILIKYALNIQKIKVVSNMRNLSWQEKVLLSYVTREGCQKLRKINKTQED